MTAFNTASLVKSQFESYKEYLPIYKLLVHYDQNDKHTFELYINNQNEKLENIVHKHFTQYNFNMSKETTGDGDFYYKIVFKGLIHNLE